MDQSAPNQFRAALTYLLDKEGRGAQTRLADEQKIDRGYLNAIVRGRKSGSETKRGEIAAHFGMVYEDMLSLGRRLLNGEDIEKFSGENAGDATSGKVCRDSLDNQPFGMNISPQHGPGRENIPRRVISVIEVLESDTGYADLLAGLIDAFHDTVRTKKEMRILRRENIDTKQEIKTLKTRITRLESGQNGEKEDYRKTA